ncbi:restriction endonuclease-like protein [Mariprofundus ferrooxydans]|uniref:restriction endonuclease-like protein n=1 Tax=Mariprofundus ferrooxydans TaxID=314344 RepID=UPI00036B4FAA|nr:restriction endonuclease-like protein [Mariprofundus ferrooxydans]
MLDILRIETEDWELNISARGKSIIARQQVLARTLGARGAPMDGGRIRFSVPITPKLLESELTGTLAVCPIGSFSELSLERPVFFENLQYHFEWIFSPDVKVNDAQVQHKLKAVCDSFRFSRRTGSAVLQGVIQTGNDVGWFRLPIQYRNDNQIKQIGLSFEVLPVKMDLENDLSAMYQTLDESLPLWRFSLAQKTEQESSRSVHRGYFPLLWLARFESLRQQLCAGLKHITYSPHSRLMAEHRVIRGDRIKGRIGYRLTERIREDQQAGQVNKRYAVKHKKMSVDTPENRFIKMVVNTTKQRLERFHQVLWNANKDPDKQLLSDAFLASIKAWQMPLARYQSQPFFQEVGEFQGMNGESLVLQQRTGYSAVYRVWQELRYYLDILGHQDSVSMKSVAEIYEVWCFLEIRRILRDDLGFEESSAAEKPGARLRRKQFELALTDGMAGAYHFSRSDGIALRLAHEPLFSKTNDTKQPIRIWTINQEPDILLEATFPDGRRFVWLFDAKYRIRPIRENADGVDYEYDASKPDLVPDDAINQMHRYRDALIHRDPENLQLGKSRPVFGAFALYPGFFNQEDPVQNPYHEAINEVGIGAFPLLPSGDDSGKAWLKSFLTEQLGLKENGYSPEYTTDRLFIRESARIPQYGMKQILYSDLTLVAPLGGAHGRTKSYLDAFADGSARWYHIPESTFSKKYGRHVAKEIAYLAIATSAGSSSRTLKRVWRVKSVRPSARNILSEEQAGCLKADTASYWLFELGTSDILDMEITSVPGRNFRKAMRLTTLANIKMVREFKDISEVYEGILV